jgi:DNA primase
MLYFGDEFVQKIKNANPLVDYLQQYTELKKMGTKYKCHCPLPDHEDKKTPSMIVFENDSAYCFGCGTNIRDSIDFKMKMDGVSFQEAVRDLAERTNIPLPKTEDKKFKKIKILQDDMMKKTRIFWQNLMRNKKYVKAKDYLLKERELTEELITEFKLGFCNEDFLNDKEYKKFTNRIIFPVFNYYGEICGFSGRLLPDGNNKYSKYINSSEENNPLFERRKLVYGLDLAKKTIRKEGFVVWVEGFMDVITLHKFGVYNVIASMGTAITDEQVDLISKFTQEIILYLDTDEAGSKAIINNLDIFDKYDILLKIVEGERGLDPAEMALKLKGDFKDWLLDKALTVEQFFSDKFLNEYNIETNKAKRKLIYKLEEIFKNKLDRIETEIALSSICNVFNIDIKTLKKYISKAS